MGDARKAHAELIRCAARLLRPSLSGHYEDNPKTTPRKVLRQIDDHLESLKLVAIDIKANADRLAALAKPVESPTPKVPNE